MYSFCVSPKCTTVPLAFMCVPLPDFPPPGSAAPALAWGQGFSSGPFSWPGGSYMVISGVNWEISNKMARLWGATSHKRSWYSWALFFWNPEVSFLRASSFSQTRHGDICIDNSPAVWFGANHETSKPISIKWDYYDTSSGGFSKNVCNCALETTVLFHRQTSLCCFLNDI